MAQQGIEGFDDGRVLTLNEAGKILNASYSTILRLVTDGELRAFRIRNSWRTSTSACEEYKRRQYAEQAIACMSVEKIR